MERCDTHCERTYMMNFNRMRAKCINRVRLNLSHSQRCLSMGGLLAI
ncbi:hypothetical protein [Hallella colorans]|uniref:Uncharacterized protein n=1 Tax=Hallella colorans TaxID=1703337 RepID=A0A2U0U796_9BACT|nr:hypothetical protein [Hallella colorans]PVX53488.1 hypothetical protein C7379_1111 [Hallella colorans]